MPFKLRLHVIDLPHGKYSGKRLGDLRPNTSSAARPAAAGSTAAICAKSSSTKGRYPIRRMIGRNDQEKASATSQLNTALYERDEYLRQRDIALSERNEFLRQRNEALAEIERLKQPHR